MRTLAVLLALLVATGCATWEAAQQLPEGYWTATWGLVQALVHDALSVVESVVGFVLPV